MPRRQRLDPLAAADRLASLLQERGCAIVVREAETTRTVYVGGYDAQGRALRQVRVSDHSRIYGTRYKFDGDLLIRPSHTALQIERSIEASLQYALR